MPFTFKLSHRLSRIKRSFVIGAAALAACEKPIQITSPTSPNSPVAQVVIAPDTVTLNPYQTQQFLAYGRTQAGDSVAVAVSWSTSGGAISSGGLYAADTVAGDFVVTGTAQASATAPTGATSSTLFSGSGGVRNRGTLTQIVEMPSSATVLVGGTVQFSAYGRTKSGDSVAVSVTWSSSNTAVATVSSSGLMTAVAAGQATISATGGAKTAAATATVTNVPVASVAVSPTTASLTVGQTAQLTATPEDSSGSPLSGRVVTWATSNASVATVSMTGLVSAVGAGSATITATSEGKSGTAAVTAAAVPVASVTVTPTTASLTVGQTTQLTATPKDANGTPLSGRAVTWATSNAGVATVSATGVVTGVAPGTATITATSEGKSGTAAITVTNVPVASVSVTPGVASLLVGGTVQLTATPKDANGNPLSGRVVTWSSSAPLLASVSSSGLVSGLAVGGVTITATSEGQSGSAALSVSGQTPLYTLGNGANYYVASTGSDANPCTPAAPCYTLGRVSQLMGPGDNAHVAPGNYTWSYSSNRVSKSGTATAPISYVSDTKWGAKIYGADCSPITNDGAYVQIINFDVTGSCVQGITTNGSYSKIIGNRVHDMPGTQLTAAIVGDCCSYTSTGIQIIGNVVDNIGPWGQVNQTHGIYIASANGVVEDNIVTRAASACIQTYHGATHLIISNNTIANCGKYGIQISADPALTTNDYTTVDNNIVVNVNGYGIWESTFGAIGTHNVYNNNIVYNNSPNFSLVNGTQSGTITLTSAQFSALFVNYTGDITGDYHLRSGAVAIDAGATLCAAGVSLCVPGFDFSGVLRPQGLAYDIGAFEYNGP
jgi:uncharacterized protein YjdB